MKLIRFLLFPIAVVYDVITSIRNHFFESGFFSSKTYTTPTIVVGNLSVGGTGKSPQIEYLIRLLKDQYKVATLSRGYKRKTEGFQIVNNAHTAEDVGDEPLQFFSKFDNITVAVDANRREGIEKLQKKKNPDVILLDDAFQHRKVKAGFYILLTKYNDLYVDDFLLPTGNLRESKRGAKRADVVVVTKCPQLTDAEKLKVKKKLKLQKHQQLFFSSIVYNEFLRGEEEVSLASLKEKEIVLVTGIAAPSPLLTFLTSEGIQFTHLKFPDHHNFTDADILKITKASQQKMILTTEKDYVRLKGRLNNLFYIGIKTTFLEYEQSFNNGILDYIYSRS